jgi:VIT1/CCC1 family predicted Fe2+/Mn2+ transporter
MEKSNALREHLLREHKQNPFAEYLREIVYGGSDGIVTTFAVVAGFSGASVHIGDMQGLGFFAVLLFGLANLFADGVSMGLGNYLAIRAEQDVYKSSEKKERHEIRENTEQEFEETLEIFEMKGFTRDDARKMTDIIMKNENYWVEWMMTHELEMANPEGTNPLLTGLATFMSFVLFGSIPLLPFLFSNHSVEQSFIYSSFGALLALILLGLLKYKVIGGGLMRSVFEIVLVGSTSAVVAYVVGVFFA